MPTMLLNIKQLMIYKHVSSRDILRRVSDHYDIKTTDWQVRAYEWIGEALRELKMFDTLTLCHTNMTVTEFKGSLPCTIEGLWYIDYKGTKLERVNSANKHDIEHLERSQQSLTYELDKVGGIIAGVRNATLRVHYYKLATVYDNEIKMTIPMVPDNEKILKAVEFYILFRVIARGYKHPVYTLNSHLSSNNPSKLWEKWRLKARNSAISVDHEAAEIHRRISASMLLDPNTIISDFH